LDFIGNLLEVEIQQQISSQAKVFANFFANFLIRKNAMKTISKNQI